MEYIRDSDNLWQFIEVINKVPFQWVEKSNSKQLFSDLLEILLKFT